MYNNTKLFFFHTPDYDGVVNNTLEFLKKNSITDIIKEIYKIKKNLFLNENQKKNIKDFIFKELRFRNLIIKFYRNLLYKVRNRKKTINEFTLDMVSSIEDLNENEIIYIYKGTSKWGFNSHEINRLFLTGIFNYDMTESDPILFSNPYIGEKINVSTAIDIFIQLKNKKCNINYLIELLAKEYFDCKKFKTMNYFILQRSSVNNFINSTPKRILLELAQSIRDECHPVDNVLNIKPLSEQLIRTVLKRELLNLPIKYKDYTATSLYVHNIEINKSTIKSKISKKLKRRKEKRKRERKKRLNKKKERLNKIRIEPIPEEKLTDSELEINIEIQNGINQLENELQDNINDLIINGTALNLLTLTYEERNLF